MLAAKWGCQIPVSSAVRMHPGRITVFVPHYAMSGGTLIALAADEIMMEEHAVLGPVDPQIGEYPAASLVKLAETKPISDIDDKSWLLADVGKKAIEQIRKQEKSLLQEKYPSEKAEDLAQILTEGRGTHDYPLAFEEAKKGCNHFDMEILVGYILLVGVLLSVPFTCHWSGMALDIQRQVRLGVPC